MVVFTIIPFEFSLDLLVEGRREFILKICYLDVIIPLPLTDSDGCRIELSPHGSLLRIEIKPSIIVFDLIYVRIYAAFKTDKGEWLKGSGRRFNMEEWIWNPKTKGSGVITAIPQEGRCPNECPDCFFQSGRSYLVERDEDGNVIKDLIDNLPHVPTKKLAKGRIVRMNDGNDSSVERLLVEECAQKFEDYFFNTAIPYDLGDFSGPVVLTVNPGEMTDTDFYKVEYTPNLMLVRIRVNAWNLEQVVEPAVEYYTEMGVPVVLTFMAYYTESIPEKHKDCYIWKKRTLNSYWVLGPLMQQGIERLFADNPLVYTCGYKGEYSCQRCGNCIREYFNSKERLRG